MCLYVAICGFVTVAVRVIIFFFLSRFPSGFNGACSAHEWTGSFLGQSVRFKMTSVCGHVMSLDFPGKFNNWDRVDPVSYRCVCFRQEGS